MPNNTRYYFYFKRQVGNYSSTERKKNLAVLVGVELDGLDKLVGGLGERVGLDGLVHVGLDGLVHVAIASLVMAGLVGFDCLRGAVGIVALEGAAVVLFGIVALFGLVG
ncbi:MAG: hypothetical protein RLZZ381_1805 [Cyanobacteriota bacterium]|jgi:hypothetical protein